MMQVFVDTKILISGIFFEGPESQLLDSKKAALVTADICYRELQEVVG
ncbi:MAG: hypothetical protein ABEK59_05270 [Halobacteria archaeon]